MKVTHIITSLGMGGAEKLIAETLPIFTEKGISTEVLVLNAFRTPLYDQLEKSGIKIIPLGNKFYDPLHIFRIAKYLKNTDIAHAHLSSPQYFLPLAQIVSGRRAKLVFTEHSTTNRRMQSRLLGIFDKWFYSRYDKIICITEGVKTALQKHIKADERKLKVIPNGINIHRIASAEPLKRSSISPDISDDDVLIIQVSGFRHGKDQATLIRALQHLPQNVKVIFAGDGETRAAHEKLADELNLSHRVFFLGIRTDIPELLKTADISVLSSNWEGLSLASLEGMASGRPFIGSDVPGIRDLAANAGILFPNGDDGALASEIQKLITQKPYYQATARNCHAKAKEFDIEKMVERTAALYRELM